MAHLCNNLFAVNIHHEYDSFPGHWSREPHFWRNGSKSLWEIVFMMNTPPHEISACVTAGVARRERSAPRARASHFADRCLPLSHPRHVASPGYESLRVRQL